MKTLMDTNAIPMKEGVIRAGRIPFWLLYLLPSMIMLILFVAYPLAVEIVNINNWQHSMIKLSELRTNLFIPVILIPISLVVGLCLAIFVNETSKGLRFLKHICLSTVAMSIMTSTLIWIFLFNQGSYVVSFCLNIVFSFIVFISSFQSMNENLYDILKISGVPFTYALRTILLPLLIPSLFFTFTITIILTYRLQNSAPSVEYGTLGFIAVFVVTMTHYHLNKKYLIVH